MCGEARRHDLTEKHPSRAAAVDPINSEFPESFWLQDTWIKSAQPNHSGGEQSIPETLQDHVSACSPLFLVMHSVNSDKLSLI